MTPEKTFSVELLVNGHAIQCHVTFAKDHFKVTEQETGWIAEVNAAGVLAASDKEPPLVTASELIEHLTNTKEGSIFSHWVHWRSTCD